MHRKRCPKCGFNYTKKMVKGTESRDINVLIAGIFLKINVENQTKSNLDYGITMYNIIGH